MENRRSDTKSSKFNNSTYVKKNDNDVNVNANDDDREPKTIVLAGNPSN